MIIYARQIRGYLKNGLNSEALNLAKKVESAITLGNFNPENKLYPLIQIANAYLTSAKRDQAEVNYLRALEIIQTYPVDSLFDKIYFNLGLIYSLRGDFERAEFYFDQSLLQSEKLLSKNNPNLAAEYLGRAYAWFNNRAYKKALEFYNRGIDIVSLKKDSVSPEIASMLYFNRGITYSNQFDPNQAIRNIITAIKFYENYKIDNLSYINSMYSALAIQYNSIGNIKDAYNYYERVLANANRDTSKGIIEFYSNYSEFLADNQFLYKAANVFENGFKEYIKRFPASMRENALAKIYYADFLLNYKVDIKKAKALYLECYEYLKKNPWDKSVMNSVSLGYSRAIAESGDYLAALDSSRHILYRDIKVIPPASLFENPSEDLLLPDKTTFDILFNRYQILYSLYNRDRQAEALKSATETAGLIISVLEKIRLNIGEEESRILLGDKYRVAYLNAIQSTAEYFYLTQDITYLEKAFEYSEKSKSAALLASMREMRAMTGIIPENYVALEKELEVRISYYSNILSEELSHEKPDSLKLETWNNVILKAVKTRDSLKTFFEEKYPEYYSIKYNTKVVSIDEIRKITGKRKNYINYVVSDSAIYIMVINREYNHIEKVKTDTSFTNTIQRFGKIIASRERNASAVREFMEFQELGHRIYSWLVEPVRKYFTSDELIISPDSRLAYFPFEALITTGETRKDLFYSSLPYLMNDFRISYAYSATLLAESTPLRSALRNRLVAFAPAYNEPVYIDSLYVVNRQQADGRLPELKYASEEADYVARLTSGRIFKDSAASKKLFNQISGKYDILHLAMHTVMNYNNPSASGMIFSNDSTGDRYLRPYEIYNLQLTAKMVVLSSCFTGSGALFGGEGVLSLARGFIFAGARSVIMSLWEVDDRSGTEIIKSFYSNLKSGKSKSEALRKARIDYLSGSDMLHSHPYYWATMVIYGDDSPVYVSRGTKILLAITLLLLSLMAFSYFRKR